MQHFIPTDVMCKWPLKICGQMKSIQKLNGQRLTGENRQAINEEAAEVDKDL